MIEEWRPVAGHDGYWVSSLGCVRSNRGTLKPFMSGGGPGRPMYAAVDLHGKTSKVHILVLRAFVRDRDGNEVCRHLNGDALDNRLANLAWGTQSENVRDAMEHGRHTCVRQAGKKRGKYRRSGGV